MYKKTARDIRLKAAGGITFDAYRIPSALIIRVVVVLLGTKVVFK